MCIPYNDQLSWASYKSSFGQATSEPDLPSAPPIVDELCAQAFKQPFTRCIQFIRDAARLVLKVPMRSIWTPIILSKNWKQLERAKINAKLTGYSFVQLVSVPAKFLVALAALATLAFSLKKARSMIEKSDGWTAHLDGRASQLEALKEEGLTNAVDREEYNQYKEWVYRIDPKFCRKIG